MDIKELCRKVYFETIESEPMPSELRRSLKTHERVPTFVDNLARELGKVPFTVKKETISQCVRDMTRWFIHSVNVVSHERLMSDMAKLTIKAKHEERENFKKEADSILEGSHEEIKIQGGREISKTKTRFKG